MATQLDTLKRLQAVDGRLYTLRQAEREKPRELEAATARMAAQEAALKAIEGKATALQLAQKEKEVELQTREAHVKKLKGQLFQLKTNKEYTAMQHEIDTLQADKSLLEEAILKGFDAIDEAGKQRQQQQRELAVQQQAFAQEKARLEQELAALREQIAALERDRQALVPDVPKPALSLYERVLVIREGLALVPLVESSCGGCHRRLPPQVINQVYLNADLVTCESCSRILYFDEAQSKL